MDILDVIRKGSETAGELDRTHSLREAAESLVGILARYEGFGVVAASPHAERVVGAAMMLDPSLKATGHGRTVVFDVSIASGTLISRAAQRLRDAGNSEPLVGLALYSLLDSVDDWSSSELDHVVVACPRGRKSGMWESAERGASRVMLAG